MIICPKCNSNKIIRNGHPNGKKQQFFCKKCSIYFYEHEPNKLPSTTIPFQIIANALYFRKLFKKRFNAEIPMRRLRKQIKMTLALYQIMDKNQGVPRQNIHYWIDTYGQNFENIISKEEVKKYLSDLYKKLYKQKNIDAKWKTIWRKKRTYMETLELTQKVFGGREKALECAKKDKDWYEEIFEQCRYYEPPEPEYEVC